MKKYLILPALALAGFFSSTEAKAASYGFTAEGAYAISDIDKEKGGVNLYGGLLALDLYTSRRDQFFLQAGYFTGDDTYSELDQTTQFTKEQIPLYIGYNYNYSLTKSITFYLSAKAGMAKTDMERKWKGEKISDNDTPFSYAVGGGFKMHLYSSWQFVVGYEYSRSYESYELQQEKVKDDQVYHIIKAGFSCSF